MEPGRPVVRKQNTLLARAGRTDIHGRLELLKEAKHQFYPFFGEGDEQTYYHIDETVNQQAYEMEQTQRGLERKLREWERKDKILTAGGQANTEAVKWKSYYKQKLDKLVKSSRGFLKRDYSAEKAWSASGRGKQSTDMASNRQKAEQQRITTSNNQKRLVLEETVVRIIPKSVGAKSYTYKDVLINPKTQEPTELVEGTKITTRKNHLIAGAGSKTPIRCIDKLLYEFPWTKEEDWTKEKGYGYIVDEYGEQIKVELHWYENPEVDELVDIKIKQDENGDIEV